MISVIIPNYNGKELLRECLPSVLEAMADSGVAHEIIVVDDASSDDSVPYLKTAFPQVRLVARPRNGGFAAAVNEGIANARHDLLLLLNNDIKLQKGFLPQLLEPFKDPKTFAVTNRAVDFDGNDFIVPFRIEFRCGQVLQVPLQDGRNRSFAFGASGGHALFDRNKCLELGCFDELFTPFYWEDADISYRAWKRGYVTVYEPNSVVLHRSQATIGKSRRWYVDYIFRRNYFIFLWKNLTDAPLVFRHIVFLPAYLAYQAVRHRNPLVFLSFAGALRHAGTIYRRRKAERPFIRSGDGDIIRRLKEQP